VLKEANRTNSTKIQPLVQHGGRKEGRRKACTAHLHIGLAKTIHMSYVCTCLRYFQQNNYCVIYGHIQSVTCVVCVRFLAALHTCHTIQLGTYTDSVSSLKQLPTVNAIERHMPALRPYLILIIPSVEFKELQSINATN